MKAILIARVSTEEQKEAGLSLPAQIARLEKHCHNKGLKIIKTCSFDESAYKNQRDEFDSIIDYIIEQKEKIIVCCDKVDRLSRNIFDKRISLLYEKALKDEIELHFVSDGQVLNSQISAAMKFQFSISLGLAKYYSDAISDNVKRANEQKLRKGEWTSKAPYGYKNITLADGRKGIIVDESASEIIKKVFALYATGAFSLELVRKKLKEEDGIDWSKSYLDKVLNNHFYYGMMLVKGKMYPHYYPPLIDKELFEQVQNVKTGFNKKQFKYAGLPYIYRGLLRCADCGLAITPERHKGHVYYHCTQYKGKHDAQWIREEEITRQLGKVFKKLQIPEDILAQTLEALNELHTSKIEFHNKYFEKYTQEQKTLTKMIDELYRDKLKGRISENDYDRHYESLRNELNEVKMRLEKLQIAEDNYYITSKYVLGISSRAYELFIGSEVEEKRQLIKLVLSNPRLDGKKIVYDAQKPFDLIMNAWDSQLWRPTQDYFRTTFFHEPITSYDFRGF